jgi:pentatricopeptide repeat protein
MGTYAMLMRHYELAGEFGKAEDALFSMVEEEPDNLGLLDFGIGFYQRLQGKSNDALLTGNLPRVELEAGLAQLAARKEAELARASSGSR